MIEEVLLRIAVALEAIAAGGGTVDAVVAEVEKPTRKPRKKTEKAPPAEEKVEEAKVEEKVEVVEGNKAATLEDVRTALTAYQKVTDAKAARSLLADKGGASALSKIDKSKYQDIIDAAKAAVDAS